MAHDYDGACAICPARPLACRGDASHDHHACSLAACGAYDLNHALMLALSQPESEAAWRAGEDVFADAQIDDVSPAEMASTFDWLKGRS